VSYLLGDRSREQSQTNGIFRNRPNGILGDVVHSSPVFVGAPREELYKYTGWSEYGSYVTFAANNSNRTPVVYVGANDGMVHAFSDTNGTELFAFMPRAAVMHGVGAIADPDYDHRYFMDGGLTVQDVYLQPNWKTVLVGTTGRAGNNSADTSGKAIFALDVTNPASFDKNDVMWEISHNAIGQITTKPVIAKLDDGHWYAILGNGYNSALGKPALIKIRLSNGDMTVIEVTGNTGGGLAGPLVWDSNGDGTFDTAYAGDLEGRVWSFNLNTNATPSIVYQAKDASGNPQPITTTLTGSVDSNSKTWIFFGTGQYMTQADMSNRDVQTWYGIRPEETNASTTRANLRERTITEQADISGFIGRNVSAASPGDMSDRLGWFMDLRVSGSSALGERIVNPSMIRGDVLLGSTLIPIADACNPGGDGFIMAVDPFTGARLSRIYFDFNNDGQFNSQDLLNGVSPSGLSVGRIPSAGIFVGDNLFFNTDSGLQERIATNPGAGAGETERVSWREVVND
jgi:type IV pilus assembly protein PilY1